APRAMAGDERRPRCAGMGAARSGGRAGDARWPLPRLDDQRPQRGIRADHRCLQTGAAWRFQGFPAGGTCLGRARWYHGTALGRPDVGRDWIEKAVAMALEIDDQYGAVGAYFHLGYLELDFGTREKALAAFLAGLELVERGDTLSTTDQVAGIGCAIADTDPRYALRLLSAAARLRTPLALPVARQPRGPRVDSAVQEARSALSEKESDAAWASGGGLTVDALQAEVREHFRSRS